jgi:uncharacterized membrane protein YccF (DUF307 family)
VDGWVTSQHRVYLRPRSGSASVGAISAGDDIGGGSPRRRVVMINPGAKMRLLLNIIWFVLAGLWMAIAYTIAALICFVLIITIPFGIASLRIALFALWPFGQTVVKRADAGVASSIGNVLWFLLCGWWLAIGHLITGVLLCVSIIGIPLGLANFKLIPVSLLPMGREIVDIDRARQLGLPAVVAVPADPATRSSTRT